MDYFHHDIIITRFIFIYFKDILPEFSAEVFVVADPEVADGSVLHVRQRDHLERHREGLVGPSYYQYYHCYYLLVSMLVGRSVGLTVALVSLSQFPPRKESYSSMLLSGHLLLSH